MDAPFTAKDGIFLITAGSSIQAMIRGAAAGCTGVIGYVPVPDRFAAAFFAAFIVEDDLLGVHVWAGYLVLALIALRLVWGFIGTRHARFSDFVRGPRQVVGYLGDAVRFNAKRYIDHSPAGGAMIVALLLGIWRKLKYADCAG